MTELLFLHWRSLGRAEKVSLALLAVVLGLWTLVPAIPQDQGYHAFADQRRWLGVPNAADVLSNIPFALVGLYGIARLFARDRMTLSTATNASLACVAVGFLATAFGSAWYHLNPNDATLVWDRLPMTLVFSGILGAALAQRVGQNVARVSLAVLFELGIAGVIYWKITGDLSLYLLLQFGGLAAIVVLLVTTRAGNDPFPWWWLVGWYAAAKVVELADHAIWNATGGLVAGHALKHLLSAVAGAGLLLPLRPLRTPAARVGASVPQRP